MLIKQTILYLPAQTIAPLVAFASVLIWAHLLIPAELGIVTMIVAIQEICYAAFFGWWGLYTLRFIAGFSEGDERRIYLRTETTAIILSSCIQIAIVIPLVRLEFGEVMTPVLTLLSLAYMISRSFNNYGADRARAEARILLYTLVQTVGPVVGFGFGLLSIWWWGPSSASVLAGFVVAQTVGIVLSLVMSDFLSCLGRPSMAMLRQALSFGGTQTTSQMLAILAMNAPRFIVSRELGLAAVGMFSVGYSLGIRASSFAVTLVTAGAYPLVVRKMQTEGREAAWAQLSKNMILVAMVVAPVAFGLLGINKSVVNILVAEPYREVTYVVLPLATLGGLFRYLRAHTSDQVFLLGLKPWFGTIVAACDIVVAIASAFIGVMVMGAAGAALGPMISGMVTFTVSFLLSRFVFGYRAPFLTFVRIIIAAASMGMAVFFLPVAHKVIILIGHVALGGIIYAGAAMLLFPDALHSLRDILARRFKRTQA